MVSLVYSVTGLGLIAEPQGGTHLIVSLCDGVFREILGLSEFLFIGIRIDKVSIGTVCKS